MATLLLGIREGDRLLLEPLRQTCAGGREWACTVNHDAVVGMFPIAFDDKECPAATTEGGQPLIYWLRPPNSAGGVWRAIPALAAAPTVLFENRALGIKSVRKETAGDPVPVVYQGPGEVNQVTGYGHTAQTQLVNGSGAAGLHTGSFPVSMKTVMTDTDLKQRRKEIQEVLLKKHKPRLVRNINGGRENGLGIRDPGETEFRKEWLKIAKDTYISVELLITDNDFRPLTSVTIHGKVLNRWENSNTLNGLGVVYELDPDLSIGDPVDVETYAPVFIQRRKLKYWVGVYYDLLDCKCTVSAGTVSHQEAVEDWGPGGMGRLRLAEYLVNELKLSTADKAPVPYPGDREDQRFQEMLRDAKRLSDPKFVVNAEQANAVQVAAVAQAGLAAPEMAAEKPPVMVGLQGQIPAARDLANAKPQLVGNKDNVLGMVHLPGGGLDVPDIVKRHMNKKK